MKHVETYHQEKIQEYYRDKDKKKPRGNKRDSSSSYSSVPQKKIKALSSEDQRLVDRKLAIWLARYQRPMALVEDEGFRSYLKLQTILIASSVTFPSNRTERQHHWLGHRFLIEVAGDSEIRLFRLLPDDRYLDRSASA
ncbi:hypothetical protein F443_11176 [Phytophthora nicotianae P1569]|uniref:Uncharacterized protein n=1 Tax=Phytophthora nicotianae P1569 TaxID=1317065 RepID=V9EXR7_PHYNI|nr:hypothetical protein F443_11176 [Phytophthora nicotianae P1569]